jgi:hypothetical protein
MADFRPLNGMCDFRQRKIKSGASIDGSFGSHRPAVPVNDALHGRQSYAGAFKLVGPMEALKYTEQLVDILHLKSDAVVPHEDFYLVCTSVGRANLDFGGASCAREFDRI